MATCIYENLIADARATGTTMKSQPCNAPAVAGSFCRDHVYCDELLELARAIGCPEMVVSSVSERGIEQPTIIVPRGLACWEEYIVRHPRRRHEKLKKRLREMAAQLYGTKRG